MKQILISACFLLPFPTALVAHPPHVSCPRLIENYAKESESSSGYSLISGILIAWDNVKAHLEAGDSLIITDRHGSSVAAEWVEEFKFRLFELGWRLDYQKWLREFFHDRHPMDLTPEMISDMTSDDISYWITYLSRCDYWSSAYSEYTCVVDEIQNGRMEPLMERLRELPHTCELE